MILCVYIYIYIYVCIPILFSKMRRSKPWSESCERERASNCELGTRLALAQARVAENLWESSDESAGSCGLGFMWIFKKIPWVDCCYWWQLISPKDWISFLVQAQNLKSENCMMFIDVHWLLNLNMLLYASFARSIPCRSSRSTVAEGHTSNVLCWLRLNESYRKAKDGEGWRRWSHFIAQRGLQQFDRIQYAVRPFPSFLRLCRQHVTFTVQVGQYTVRSSCRIVPNDMNTAELL